MNKRIIIKADDDDEDFPSESDSLLGFSVKTRTACNFIVHIDRGFKDASYYSKVFDMMLSASELDTVDFFISSPGGDLQGLNVLMEGIKLTDANVRAVIVGECHSAASIFAMHCHDVIVCDSASMLVHNIRTGFGGKMADLAAYTAFSEKISKKLINDAYKHFLSAAEIQEVLNGRELWLDADQIRERFTSRDMILQAEADAKEKPEAKVKPKKKKAPSK